MRGRGDRAPGPDLGDRGSHEGVEQGRLPCRSPRPGRRRCGRRRSGCVPATRAAIAAAWSRAGAGAVAACRHGGEKRLGPGRKRVRRTRGARGGRRHQATRTASARLRSARDCSRGGDTVEDLDEAGPARRHTAPRPGRRAAGEPSRRACGRPVAEDRLEELLGEQGRATGDPGLGAGQPAGRGEGDEDEDDADAVDAVGEDLGGRPAVLALGADQVEDLVLPVTDDPLDLGRQPRGGGRQFGVRVGEGVATGQGAPALWSPARRPARPWR